MERQLKKPKMPPPTASVRELAEFWDTHSLADFQDELVDVKGPVFAREDAVQVQLDSTEAEAVDKLARARKCREPR